MHAHRTQMAPNNSEGSLRNDIVRHVCATQYFFTCHVHPLLCCARVLCQKLVGMVTHLRVSQIVSPDSAVNFEITSCRSVSIQIHSYSLFTMRYIQHHELCYSLHSAVAIQQYRMRDSQKSEMLWTWSEESVDIPTTAQISRNRTASSHHQFGLLHLGLRHSVSSSC